MILKSFVVLGGVGLIGCGPPANGAPQDAESACETFVKQQLKSPSTAQFTVTMHGQIVGDGLWAVVGTVDAQNSFGATIRNSYYCRVHHTTGYQYDLDSIAVK